MFLECDMHSCPLDIDLEEIWTYDSASMTHDFMMHLMWRVHLCD
jgi:hypothetical protein